MAHDKVYAICENKCREETLTKTQIEEKIGNTDEYFNGKIEMLQKIDLLLQNQIDGENGVKLRLDSNKDEYTRLDTNLDSILGDLGTADITMELLKNSIMGVIVDLQNTLGNLK